MIYQGLIQRPAEDILTTSHVHAFQLNAYWVGWLSVGAAVPVSAVLLLASGMRLVIESFLPLTVLIMLLGAAHVVYDKLRPSRYLALSSGVLAMLTASGVLAAIISHTGLRLGQPFVDAALSAADVSLGIDTPRLALTLALHPTWGQPLNIIYMSTLPTVFLAAIFLGLRDQDERAWELVSCFSTSIIAASIISVFFPALGSMVYHHIDGIADLPTGAGNYHLGTVHYFRDGQNPAFDMAKLSGVVTMPSFHMVMALLVPYSLRRTGVLWWTAVAWSVLVMLSTVAIGGHYVIDLIVGAALWAFIAWLVRQRGTEPAMSEGLRPCTASS